MRVGDQQVAMNGLRSLGGQDLPKSMRAGAAVQDDQCTIGRAHFDT